MRRRVGASGLQEFEGTDKIGLEVITRRINGMAHPGLGGQVNDRIGAVPGDAPVGPQDSLSPVAPFRVVNIGASQPTPLMDYIAALEEALGQPAQKILKEMQAGDVPATWADTSLLSALTGYRAEIDVRTGVARFVDWYRGYYSA